MVDMKEGPLKRGVDSFVGLLVCMSIIIPLFFMFMTSIKSNVAIFTDEILNFAPTLGGWITIIFASGAVKSVGGDWPLYYWNSVVVSLISTGVALLIGLPAAYALARYDFKRKNFTAFMILSVRLIPPIAFLIPDYLIVLFLKIQTTYMSVIMFYIVFQIPFVVWIMRGFIEQVPKAVEEAAAVDGASQWYTFLRILLPLAKDGLIVTAVFCILQSWNEFLLGWTFLSGNSVTLPVAAAHLVDYVLISWNTLFVVGTISAIPPIVLAILVQKHLVRGLTLGMVKG